jgi:hypothetical protein
LTPLLRLAWNKQDEFYLATCVLRGCRALFRSPHTHTLSLSLSFFPALASCVLVERDVWMRAAR